MSFIKLKEINVGEDTVLTTVTDNNLLIFTKKGVINLFDATMIKENFISVEDYYLDRNSYTYVYNILFNNKNKDFLKKYIENIIVSENMSNIVNEEDIYFNKWNNENIKDFNKFDFLENVANIIEFKHPVNQFYYVDGNNNLYVFSIGKNNIKDKTKYFLYKTQLNLEEDSEMLTLFINGFSPSIIYLYEIYKQEKKLGNKFYTKFYIQEPDKKREINAPSEPIKKASRILLRQLNASFNTRLVKNNFRSNQFAYINGKSILDNANIHKNNKHQIKTDIKHFFDSCKYEYWKKYIEFLFGSKYAIDYKLLNNVKKSIQDVLINPETGGLYMGNPVSGVLSNMIMHPVMLYIRNILDNKFDEGEIEYRIDVSLYADDITFSTNDPDYKNNKYFNKKYLKSIVYTAFEYYDLKEFKLKPEKTVSQNNQRRKVTGLRINHNNQVTIQKNKYNLVKVMCHRLSLGQEITIPYSKLQGLMSFYIHNDESGKFLKLARKYKDVLTNLDIHLPKVVFQEGEKVNG